MKSLWLIPPTLLMFACGACLSSRQEPTSASVSEFAAQYKRLTTTMDRAVFCLKVMDAMGRNIDLRTIDNMGKIFGAELQIIDRPTSENHQRGIAVVSIDEERRELASEMRGKPVEQLALGWTFTMQFQGTDGRLYHYYVTNEDK